MKIFVTGGNGYLGSALAYKMLEAGHDVSVSVRNGIDASLFPRGLEPKTLRTIHPILVRHVQPIVLLARDLLKARELFRP